MTERMANRNGVVAVTGIGVVSPVGLGRVGFWSALVSGMSGIRRIPESVGLPSIGAQMVEYIARDFIATAQLRRMDKISRALVASVRMALDDASLGPETLPADRVGVAVGTALGNIDESVQYLHRLFEKGPALVSPMVFPNLVLNAAASYAAMESVSTGVNFTVSEGEVPAEQAIELAMEVLNSRGADVMLVGGVDEWSEIVIEAYRSMRALSGQQGGEEHCRPFDVRRNGIVLGEGAAAFVLESLEHARLRRRPVYAVIESALTFTIPAGPYVWPRFNERAVLKLQRWLESVLPRGAAVDFVMTNANGSRALDEFHLQLLARLFGESAAGMTLGSVRGAIGEFGAAGALSVAAACLALHEQAIVPFCQPVQPPAGVPFRFGAPGATARTLRRVLHLSVARGGLISAMLLAHPDV